MTALVKESCTSSELSFLMIKKFETINRQYHNFENKKTKRNYLKPHEWRANYRKGVVRSQISAARLIPLF